LTDGAEFVKRDGSVPLTGNLDAGANKITNGADGTANTDLVTKQQMDAAIATAIASFIADSKFRFEALTHVDPPGDRTKWQFNQDPSAGKYLVFRGGGLAWEGATEDYTRNGTVITFNSGKEPDAEQSVFAFYIQS
jgi:hypothetical protein